MNSMMRTVRPPPKVNPNNFGLESSQSTDPNYNKYENNLSNWKRAGYPSEYAYAKALGVLDMKPKNPTYQQLNEPLPLPPKDSVFDYESDVREQMKLLENSVIKAALEDDPEYNKVYNNHKYVSNSQVDDDYPEVNYNFGRNASNENARSKDTLNNNFISKPSHEIKKKSPSKGEIVDYSYSDGYNPDIYPPPSDELIRNIYGVNSSRMIPNVMDDFKSQPNLKTNKSRNPIVNSSYSINEIEIEKLNRKKKQDEYKLFLDKQMHEKSKIQELDKRSNNKQHRDIPDQRRQQQSLQNSNSDKIIYNNDKEHEYPYDSISETQSNKGNNFQPRHDNIWNPLSNRSVMSNEKEKKLAMKQQLDRQIQDDKIRKENEKLREKQEELMLLRQLQKKDNKRMLNYKSSNASELNNDYDDRKNVNSIDREDNELLQNKRIPENYRRDDRYLDIDKRNNRYLDDSEDNSYPPNGIISKNDDYNGYERNNILHNNHYDEKSIEKEKKLLIRKQLEQQILEDKLRKEKEKLLEKEEAELILQQLKQNEKKNENKRGKVDNYNHDKDRRQDLNEKDYYTSPKMNINTEYNNEDYGINDRINRNSDYNNDHYDERNNRNSNYNNEQYDRNENKKIITSPSKNIARSRFIADMYGVNKDNLNVDPQFDSKWRPSGNFVDNKSKLAKLEMKALLDQQLEESKRRKEEEEERIKIHEKKLEEKIKFEEMKEEEEKKKKEDEKRKLAFEQMQKDNLLLEEKRLEALARKNKKNNIEITSPIKKNQNNIEMNHSNDIKNEKYDNNYRNEKISPKPKKYNDYEENEDYFPEEPTYNDKIRDNRNIQNNNSYDSRQMNYSDDINNPPNFKLPSHLLNQNQFPSRNLYPQQQYHQPVEQQPYINPQMSEYEYHKRFPHYSNIRDNRPNSTDETESYITNWQRRSNLEVLSSLNAKNYSNDVRISQDHNEMSFVGESKFLPKDHMSSQIFEKYSLNNNNNNQNNHRNHHPQEIEKSLDSESIMYYLGQNPPLLSEPAVPYQNQITFNKPLKNSISTTIQRKPKIVSPINTQINNNDIEIEPIEVKSPLTKFIENNNNFIKSEIKKNENYSMHNSPEGNVNLSLDKSINSTLQQQGLSSITSLRKSSGMSDSSISTNRDGLPSKRYSQQPVNISINYDDNYDIQEHNDEWIGDEEIIVIPNTSNNNSSINILQNIGKEVVSPQHHTKTFDNLSYQRNFTTKGAILSDDDNDLIFPSNNRKKNNWDKSTPTKNKTILQLNSKSLVDSQEYSDDYEDDVDDEESIENSDENIDFEKKYSKLYDTNITNEKLKWGKIGNNKP